MTAGLVTVDDIRAAAVRIRGVVVRTPLLPAPWAGQLWLKPECLQPTGAFKLRGAYNAVAKLSRHVRADGVVAHSSGNHSQAVAWAARAHGVPAVIVMPDGAAPVKVAATRALGAEVVIVAAAERESGAEEIRVQRGMTLIPPFDHADIIAGAGTVGLEIADDAATLDGANVDTVLVPVGGGGLVSGVSAAVKALAPGVRVVGVEPELAADLAEGFALGRRVAWTEELTYRTIADGVRSPAVGELPWRHIQAHVDDVVTVSEDAIIEAMALVTARSRVVAEPTGALAVAAFLAEPERFGATVAVVSGGNVDPALLAEALRRVRPGRG